MIFFFILSGLALFVALATFFLGDSLMSGGGFIGNGFAAMFFFLIAVVALPVSVVSLIVGLILWATS